MTPCALPVWSEWEPTVRNWEKQQSNESSDYTYSVWNRNYYIGPYDLLILNDPILKATLLQTSFLNSILWWEQNPNLDHSIFADALLFFTFWTDLANFLHIVLGAIVDGMCDSTLTDGLMFACWCGAEHGHIFHSLAELSGCNTNTT